MALLSKVVSSAPLVVLLATTADRVSSQDVRPNFIVMQPDDLQFYEAWDPPAHFRGRQGWPYPPNSSLPHMNRLRLDGVRMLRAYTASPKCGTSRYSTMTGRYPSRSSFSRVHDDNDGRNVSQVGIGTTKIHDEAVDDGDDCSTGNLAALLQTNGYHTGVVGKWHLLNTNRRDTYQDVQNSIRACGFNYTEAIYKENLGGWTNDEFHHNMEYVTSRAIQFIEDTPGGVDRVPFFLYVNPTVPHGPNVLEALDNYNCSATPEDADLPPDDPVYSVPGMTGDYGGDCLAYRASVKARAAPSVENNDLGSVWVDDAVGAILRALEDKGELANTLFLYQQDHGQEGKDGLFEPGARIAQFVHFPDGGFHGPYFDGVVSTVDVGATVADYAGLGPGSSGWYDMDGRSWKAAIQGGSDWGSGGGGGEGEDRCVVGEMDRDRSVTCGCTKYMRIYNVSANTGTVNDGLSNTFNLDFAEEMLFDLCNETGNVATTGQENPEETNIIADAPVRYGQLKSYLDCHLDKTDPGNPPLYQDCTLPPAPPTESPTDRPTASPTVSPTDRPTPSPTPAPTDNDEPLVESRIPADGEYLGDVTSYVFAAEVTDLSSLDFVRFEFQRPGDGSRFSIDGSINMETGMYYVDLTFDEEGTWLWRIVARDVHRNRVTTSFDSVSVANSHAQVAALAREEIEDIISDDPPLAAKFVRMGFHDCVGGCDGCIDMSNGDNAGLDVPISALDPVVAKYETEAVSRADIWAIAALAACDVSLPNADRGRFPLTHVGRRNCVGGATAGPGRSLPSPDLTTHEILAFFDGAFGFDPRETVALMGAHTLGRMTRANSGFEGQWVGNSAELNNRYYDDLVGGQSVNATDDVLFDAPDWDLEVRDNSDLPGIPDRTEWVHTGGNGGRTVMTSSDIALVRDLNNGTSPDYLDESTGEVTCQFRCNRRNCALPVCPAARQTMALMAIYKHDNDLWVDDFEDVMGRMMVSGYSVTTCADAVCVLGAVTETRSLRGGKL